MFIFSYWLGSAVLKFKHEGQYLASDCEEYSLYLRAVFIHGTFENIPVWTKNQLSTFPNNNKLATRFTYGVALMELPFFAIAQLSRKIQGYDTKAPFSNDFSVMMLVSGCFYMTLGLFFVYRSLIRQFQNKKAVYWTIAILYFGSSLLNYGIREPTMSHIYTFCLVAAIINILPSFWQKKQLIKRILLMGFLVSLVILTRPTNFLIAIVVLLYDINSISDLKNRFTLIIQQRNRLCLIPLIGILMAIPQMAYWHYLSGKWLINLYSEIHHAVFKWSTPHFYDVLFHPCNGFLYYTPIMCFTLLGMSWLAIRNKFNGRLYLIIFLTTFYLSASWCMWWFGHAYGHRPFVDYYPLMAFGLAYYINELYKTKMQWFKYLNFSIFAFLMFVNFRFTIVPFYWQVEPDGSLIEQYWKAFHWVFDLNKWW
jgi:hypothetical protein